MDADLTANPFSAHERESRTVTALMSWLDRDELQPYPWATVPCPECGETELAGGCMSARTAFDFVCMNCGCVTKIEECS